MEKNKIYIPINIQTETMIFQGYGMSELFKTLAFTAITSVIWIILFIKTYTQHIHDEYVHIYRAQNLHVQQAELLVL